ncbi:MAG: T9SS type A sorting domain-containing protein [Bacteroidota bacterium]
MKRIYLILLSCMLATGLEAQSLTLVYEVLTGTTGTDTLVVSMRNNTGSTLDLGAVNLSMAYQASCGSIASYGSTFSSTWGSGMEFGNDLTIARNYEYTIMVDGTIKSAGLVTYDQRWQYGNTDQNFSAPTAVSLAANGGIPQEVLRVEIQNNGCAVDAYLEDLSENPANEISDLAGTPVDYEIERVWDVLPVEWLDFRAFQVGLGAAQLEWTTANEVNNAAFEIEKSLDGTLFEQIGSLNGQGNSTQLTGYEFTDTKVAAYVNYYRIRQVDFNGDFSYSEVREVRMDGAFGFHVDMYPNPAIENINLSAELDSERTVSLILVDMNGRALQEMRNVSIGGNQVITLQVGNLPSGMYSVRLMDENYEPVFSNTFVKK